MDYMPAKTLTKQASTTYGPPNLGVDTVSNFGLTVISRSDKPDYSMTKGGVRLWLSVALFLLLLSAFATLTSRAGRRDLDDNESNADDIESHKISVVIDDQNDLPISNQPESPYHHTSTILDFIESSSNDQNQENQDQESSSLVEDQLLAKLSLKAKGREGEEEVQKIDLDRLDTDDQYQKSAIPSKIDRPKKKSLPIIDTCEIGDPNCGRTLKIIKVRKTKGKSSSNQNDHVTKKSIDEFDLDRKIKVKKTKGADHAIKVDLDSRQEKIKVKKTKGQSITEDRSDQEEKIDNDEVQEQSIDHVVESDPDRKIKVKRTKGRPMIVEDQNEHTAKTEFMDQDTKIKVHRTKGKSESIDNRPQIKVYKTKGSEESIDHQNRRLRLENQADQKISHLLDRADQFFEKGDFERALKEYENLIVKYPKSASAHYGRAKVLDQLSDEQKSNQLLEESFREYELVLNFADVTDDLYMLCAERLVDRLQFRGWIKKSIKIQEAMLSKFPQNVTLLKQYGLTFLILGQNERAEKIFKKVLKQDPENGHVSALYGFVLKTSLQNRLEESIDFLYKGVKSRDQQAQDARFYFHLGDALQRLDRTSEAYDIYEQGVLKGFFISKYQRSLYNVPNLKSRPWWSYSETTYEKYLKVINLV